MAAQYRSGGGACAEMGVPGNPGTGARAAATARPIAAASSAASSGLTAQRGTRLQTARAAMVAAAIARPSQDSTGISPSIMIPTGVPSALSSAMRPPLVRESAHARHAMSSAADTAIESTGSCRAGRDPPAAERWLTAMLAHRTVRSAAV